MAAVSTYYVTLSDVRIPIRERIRSDWKFTEHEGVRAGRTVGLVAWSGKAPNGSPFVASNYLPETVVDVRSLLRRAAELGCGITCGRGSISSSSACAAKASRSQCRCSSSCSSSGPST